MGVKLYNSEYAVIWHISFFFTHWGQVMHLCIGNLTIIVSYNGLSSGQRQAIIWANAGILLNGPLWTNFSEILIEILTFSFKKMQFKALSVKWQLFCLCLNLCSHSWSIFMMLLVVASFMNIPGLNGCITFKFGHKILQTQRNVFIVLFDLQGLNFVMIVLMDVLFT